MTASARTVDKKNGDKNGRCAFNDLLWKPTLVQFDRMCMRKNVGSFYTFRGYLQPTLSYRVALKTEAFRGLD